MTSRRQTIQSVDIGRREYKVWAIVMTISTLVVAIAAVIFLIAWLGANAELQQLKTENETVKTDSAEVPTYESPETVDISGLDGSKLVTASDLAANEIPDHYTGNKNASVVVIEYEDFACSHCQALAADAEKIHADYGDRVLFIHRGFNLGFPNSEKTLRAAEAAYQLGGEKAYWAIAKLLYQDTRWLGEDVFGGHGMLSGYAKQIGLDVSEFNKAIANVTSANKLARDKELGSAAGVSGTPTWIINGQTVTPRDADIRAALDAALL